MDVSLVIPTYNRANLIGKTIPALASQVTGDFTYEVIFVSNGSSDSTVEVLNEAAKRYSGRIRYYSIAPTGGPSAPRNVGIRAAQGDAVIILDDDVLPDPDLMLRHAEFHKAHPEPQHAALGTVYVPPDLLLDPISFFHAFPYDRIRTPDRLGYLYFWTCHISVKRKFMLEMGMFDENFLYFEDVLCGHRLEQNGMHLHFLPAARGQHLHQLKASGIPAKGLFTGRWLHAFEQVVSDRAMREKFGILSMDLPPKVLLRRILNRVGLSLLNNRAAMAGLKWMGANRSSRNRVSDLYYYVIFRGNMLAGYREAKRQARRTDLKRAVKEWVDRGE